MSRTVSRVFFVLALLSLTTAPVAASSSAAGDTRTITLDGQDADLAAATMYHCHDVVQESLKCFRVEVDRDVDAGRAVDSNDFAAASSGAYMVAWDFTGFAGSSVLLSQDYADLGVVGWNDRISSYKAYTTQTGYFYQHASYAGNVQAFCCNAQVSNVGSTHNNTFSSLNLP